MQNQNLEHPARPPHTANIDNSEMAEAVAPIYLEVGISTALRFISRSASDTSPLEQYGLQTAGYPPNLSPVDFDVLPKAINSSAREFLSGLSQLKLPDQPTNATVFFTVPMTINSETQTVAIESGIGNWSDLDFDPAETVNGHLRPDRLSSWLSQLLIQLQKRGWYLPEQAYVTEALIEPIVLLRDPDNRLEQTLPQKMAAALRGKKSRDIPSPESALRPLRIKSSFTFDEIRVIATSLLQKQFDQSQLTTDRDRIAQLERSASLVVRPTELLRLMVASDPLLATFEQLTKSPKITFLKPTIRDLDPKFLRKSNVTNPESMPLEYLERLSETKLRYILETDCWLSLYDRNKENWKRYPRVSDVRLILKDTALQVANTSCTVAVRAASLGSYETYDPNRGQDTDRLWTIQEPKVLFRRECTLVAKPGVSLQQVEDELALLRFHRSMRSELVTSVNTFERASFEMNPIFNEPPQYFVVQLQEIQLAILVPTEIDNLARSFDVSLEIPGNSKRVTILVPRRNGEVFKTQIS